MGISVAATVLERQGTAAGPVDLYRLGLGRLAREPGLAGLAVDGAEVVVEVQPRVDVIAGTSQPRKMRDPMILVMALSPYLV